MQIDGRSTSTGRAMSPASILSIVAATLGLGFALVFLLLARAPGWRRARLYALLAFTAGCYSTVDTPFALPGTSMRLLELLYGLNYFLGSANCAVWILLAFSRSDDPWWRLSRTGLVAIGFTLTLGLVALVPGTTVGTGTLVVDLPWAATRYAAPQPSTFAQVVGAWLVLMFIGVLVRLVRSARRRAPEAWVNLITFGIFLVSVIEEVLVSNGILAFFYTADLGFLAVIATMLVHAVRRVVSDGRRLEVLSRELGAQVEHRTRERDLARDALAHAERLAAVGQLAAGVGHEINNPLTVVRANLEMLHEEPGRLDATVLVEEALDGAGRIAKVVGDLRAYALPAANRSELVDVGAVLRAARKLAAHRLRHVASVVEDVGVLTPVRGDPVRLSQVFVNLLVNAGDALEDARRADPSVTVRARVVDGQVEVEIVDNGVGIPADALARLSEPYFSTRVERGGTGLGLFVARGILSSVGGSLEFTSTVGVGTTARVSLPAAGPVSAPRTVSSEPALRLPPSSPVVAPRVSTSPAPPCAPAPEETPVHEPPSREPDLAPSPPGATPGAPPRPRVVVVDDEPAVARSVGRMLAGYEIVAFSDARTALDYLRATPGVGAVVCDLMMPRMNGMELLAAVAVDAPALAARFVFVTGGAVTAGAQAFLARADVRHVTKPIDRAALRRAVDELAAAAQA